MSSETNIEIKEAMVKSYKWSFLSSLIVGLSQPIFSLILSYLLLPKEFGVLATATISISLASLFFTAGVGKHLIQRKDNIQEASIAAFWINSLLGLISTLIIIILAPFIADFFNDPDAVLVIQIMSVQVFFTALYSVQINLAIREMRFKILFFIQMVSTATFMILTLILALANFGVWALVTGNISYTFITLLLLWKYFNSLDFIRNVKVITTNLKVIKEVLFVGSWFMFEAILAWVLQYIDSTILGHYFGTQTLGLYQFGRSLVSLVFGSLFGALLPILYTSFSKMYASSSQIKEPFLKSTYTISTFCIPMGFSLVLLGQVIEGLFFSDNWVGLGLVVSTFGFINAFSWLVSADPEAYRAIGRPDIPPKRMIITASYWIPTFLLFSQIGFNGFCFIRALLVIPGLVLHTIFSRIFLGINPRYLWDCAKTPFLSTIAMIIILFVEIQFFTPLVGITGIIKLAGVILSGFMIYFAFLFIIDRKRVLFTYELAKKVIGI